MARWTSAAATEESTPPDSPQMTRASPTSSRPRATSLSTKCSGVQSGSQPQAPKRKLAITSPPRGVCATSGWNWTPNSGFVSCSIPAMGEFSLLAVTVHPGGGSSTWSPWLIQTGVVAPGVNPRKSWPPSTRTSARPYSRRLAPTTRPPERCASNCIP